MLIPPHQQKLCTGSAHNSARSKCQEPASLVGWWLGTCSAPTLLLLQFALLFQIRSGGFEKYHWHLLTTSVPVLPKLKSTWTSVSPSTTFCLSTPSPISCLGKEKKQKNQDLQQQVSYFKVYNHTHTTQFLCKFWMQWRPSQFLLDPCFSSNRLLLVNLRDCSSPCLSASTACEKCSGFCHFALLLVPKQSMKKPKEARSAGGY